MTKAHCWLSVSSTEKTKELSKPNTCFQTHLFDSGDPAAFVNIEALHWFLSKYHAALLVSKKER